MSRRVEQAAARRVEKAKAALAARLSRDRSIRVEHVPAGIAISGRRLAARWLNDARLRWIGARL